MNLSDAEKLILGIVCEIHTHLKLHGSGFDTPMINKAIHSGNEWAIGATYGGVIGIDEGKPSYVSEVYDILDMWCFMEEAYDSMNSLDKDALEKQAAPFGKNVRFPGFDGNNESDYHSAAKFIIDELHGFGSQFSGRDLNSHSKSLDAYRRMYKIFEPIRKNLVGRKLNVQELASILLAYIP